MSELELDLVGDPTSTQIASSLHACDRVVSTHVGLAQHILTQSQHCDEDAETRRGLTRPLVGVWDPFLVRLVRARRRKRRGRLLLVALLVGLARISRGCVRLIRVLVCAHDEGRLRLRGGVEEGGRQRKTWDTGEKGERRQPDSGGQPHPGRTPSLRPQGSALSTQARHAKRGKRARGTARTVADRQGHAATWGRPPPCPRVPLEAPLAQNKRTQSWNKPGGSTHCETRASVCMRIKRGNKYLKGRQVRGGDEVSFRGGDKFADLGQSRSESADPDGSTHR